MDAMNRDEYMSSMRLSWELLWKGYGLNRVSATVGVHYQLSKITSQLVRLTQPKDDHKEIVSVDILNDGNQTFLPHDDVLLPAWVKFSGALSAVPANKQEQGFIRLSLRNVQLNNEVSDLLLDSFKKAPLISLFLSNNSQPHMLGKGWRGKYSG